MSENICYIFRCKQKKMINFENISDATNAIMNVITNEVPFAPVETLNALNISTIDQMVIGIISNVTTINVAEVRRIIGFAIIAF